MRSYLFGKGSLRIHVSLVLGIAISVASVLGGLLAVSKLDGYIQVMYFGNSAPIGHLANIRAAEINIRRLHWRIFALRNPVSTDEYSREIRHYLDVIAREWRLYYPEGVSSAREKRLAAELADAVPQAITIAREFLRRLETGNYESVMLWYQGKIPALDHLDRLLTANIDTNVEQAARFATLSRGVLNQILWIAIALLVLGVAAVSGVVLHWRRQRDSAERKAREHLWLVDQVFNISMDGVIITDHLGRITKVNPAFVKMSGYAEEELLGATPSLWHSGRQSSEFYSEMWRSLSDTGYWQGKLWNRKKSGDLYLESLSITAIRGLNSSEVNYAAVCSDITKQHEEQEFQGYLATHDPLTDLPNRVLFHERLTQAIARGHRAGLQVAIFFLDLDHFKEINDRLGHTVGDATLTAIATRLKACLREADTVARLGGDEFAMVLEDIRDVNEIEPIARKVLESVGEVILSEGHLVSVTPSIGISVYPDHGHIPQVLVKLADLAMYEAKNAGKNAIRFHAQQAHQV